jgi:hypothetical protein
VSAPDQRPAAPSSSDGAVGHGSPGTTGAREVPAELRAELDAVLVRIDGLRARMRTAVDLLGVLLLGISGAALLVLTVLAVAGFAGSDTGIGFLFSALAIICLPLVAFAAWRAFQPLWQLSREKKVLHAREQVLRAEVDPLPPVPVRPPEAARAEAAARRLPPGRSATGWRTPAPSPDIRQVLSTRQVGWRVVIGVGFVMLLFAAGVLVGVLGRG